MLVSIVVPIYNISHYLKDCLDSCLRQSYMDIEIICVDDGSTDNSGDIAEAYAINDSRFKVIHKPNGGLPSARKIGIEASSGEYIFHLDGDDNIPDNAIELLVDMAKSEKADIIIGDYYKYDPENDKLYCDSRIDGILNGNEFLLSILGGGLFNIWGKLIKRAIYEENTIQIPLNISMGEDLVAMVQLAYFSKKVCACKASVYNYYIRPTSMSKVTKNVIGILSDRVIFAVEFIMNFLAPRVDGEIKEQLAEFVKRFVYQYMQSPYSVSLRKHELKHLLEFLKTMKFGKKSFSSTICHIAYYNQNASKAIVKLSSAIRG